MSVVIFRGTVVDLVDDDLQDVQLVNGLPNPVESGFTPTLEEGDERSWTWVG